MEIAYLLHVGVWKEIPLSYTSPTGGIFIKRMHYRSLAKLQTWETSKIIWLKDNDLNVRGLERSSLILYKRGLNPIA